MKIHNLYSDLLVSLSDFICKYVLEITQHPINTTYNLGNTSFQLNYDTRYSLPQLVVSLNDYSPVSRNPQSFNVLTTNINEIEVLYNHTKNISLYTQEQLFLINVDVLINCESQMQAIDAKNRLEVVLPINKPLHIFKFTSFIKLDDLYLNPFLFDIQNDDVENVFLKYDSYTDEYSHCFGVNYEPLVKVTSSVVSLDSTNNTTFGLSLSFEITNQVPIFLKTSQDISKIYKRAVASDIRKYKDISRLDYDVPVGDYDYLLMTIVANGFVKRLVVPTIFDEFYFVGLSQNLEHGRLSFVIEKINQLLYIDFNIQDNIIPCSANLKTNLLTGATSLIVSDNRINGLIKSFTIVGQSIRGWFDGYINDVPSQFEIDAQFVQIGIKNEYSDISVILDNSSDYFVSQKVIIPTRDSYKAISSINKFGALINYDKTFIKGISLIDNVSIVYLSNMTPLALQPNGDFDFQIMYQGSNYQINGNINLKTGIIQNINFVDFNNPQLTLLIKLNSLLIDFNFDMLPVFGSNIERISIDYHITNSPVSSISTQYLNNTDNPTNNNIIITEINPTIVDGIVRFGINIPHNTIQLNDLIGKKIYYKFICPNKRTTCSNRTDITLDPLLSNINSLVFETKYEFFNINMAVVSKVNPMFFSFGFYK